MTNHPSLPAEMSARPRVSASLDRRLAPVLAATFALAYELAIGASFTFAGLTAFYVVSVFLAIRSVGGVKTVFGCVFLYFSAQQVFLSQVFKPLLGEAPEHNLRAPNHTMMAEILVMLGFAAGGYLMRNARPNRGRPLFPPSQDLAWLRQLAIASTLLALVRIAITTLAGNSDLGGGGVNPLRLLNIIDVVAVSSAVAVALADSKGRRLTNSLVWAVSLPLMALNLVFGVRQGIVAVVASIALAGWAFGYRFRIQHFAIAGVLAYLFVFIFSPFSLNVRAQSRGGDFAHQYGAAIDLLEDVIAHPAKYQEADRHVLEVMPKENFQALYYDIQFGPASNLLERFAIIKPTDMIVDVTEKEGTTGWTNIAPGFAMLLPNFVGFEKDLRSPGNKLAHRVPGLVGKDDFFTPITMGLTADAFGAFGYWGAFLIPMVAMLVMLTTYRFLTRLELDHNIYGPAILIGVYHSFSEGTTANLMTLALYNPLIVAVAFFAATRAANLLNFRYLRPRAIPEYRPDESAARA